MLDSGFESLVLDHRFMLLDTKRLFKSVCGYLKGEIKRANGENTGKLGSNRKEAIEKYGFSPKNFVHALRLAWCGRHFIETGTWVCDISQVDKGFQALLGQIKFEPERFSVEGLNLSVASLERALFDTFDERDVDKDYVFNKKYADEVLLRLYYKQLSLHVPIIDLDKWQKNDKV